MIDMSAGTAQVEPLNMDWARLYVGGKGLMLRYLWDLTEPGMDPGRPRTRCSSPRVRSPAPT